MQFARLCKEIDLSMGGADQNKVGRPITQPNQQNSEYLTLSEHIS